MNKLQTSSSPKPFEIRSPEGGENKKSSPVKGEDGGRRGCKSIKEPLMSPHCLD